MKVVVSALLGLLRWCVRPTLVGASYGLNNDDGSGGRPHHHTLRDSSEALAEINLVIQEMKTNGERFTLDAMSEDLHDSAIVFLRALPYVQRDRPMLYRSFIISNVYSRWQTLNKNCRCQWRERT